MAQRLLSKRHFSPEMWLERGQREVIGEGLAPSSILDVVIIGVLVKDLEVDGKVCDRTCEQSTSTSKGRI